MTHCAVTQIVTRRPNRHDTRRRRLVSQRPGRGPNPECVRRKTACPFKRLSSESNVTDLTGRREALRLTRGRARGRL